MPHTPHYLRVARSIALVSALAGAPACATSHTRGEPPPSRDAAVPRDDATLVARDASLPDPRLPDAHRADSGYTCETCQCMGVGGDDDPDVVYCEHIGLWDCCVAIGPLFPPDLPA